MRRRAKTFRARQGRSRLDLRNAIRRVVLGLTGGSDWGIFGYEFTDLETGDETVEGADDDPAPVFQGIGIYARPVGANAEAIMLHVGAEADHPVLAAVRDEDGRRAYVDEFGEVEPGEVAIYNGQGKARVLLMANGDVEVTPASGQKVYARTEGGSSEAVATKSDIDALASYAGSHVHSNTQSALPGNFSGTPSTAAPSASGTQNFEAE